MPGANVVNLSLILGDRYFGWRGALAALAGMLAFPLAVVLALTVALSGVADHGMVQGALRGMSAVSAGLIAGTGFKLMAALRTNAMGLVICTACGVATFVAIAVFRLPLVGVLLGIGVTRMLLGLPSIACTSQGGAAMSPWGWPELATLFLHFMTLSLMSVGGAITTVPEMHRYLVNQQAWLSESQFSSCIALAQAAPGPNLLFVAVLGWTVGMNAAGGPSAGPWAWWLASVSVFVAMMGILLPSTTLTFLLRAGGSKTVTVRPCAPSNSAWRPSSWVCWCPPAGFLGAHRVACRPHPSLTCSPLPVPSSSGKVASICCGFGHRRHRRCLGLGVKPYFTLR